MLRIIILSSFWSNFDNILLSLYQKIFQMSLSTRIVCVDTNINMSLLYHSYLPCESYWLTDKTPGQWDEIFCHASEKFFHNLPESIPCLGDSITASHNFLLLLISRDWLMWFERLCGNFKVYRPSHQKRKSNIDWLEMNLKATGKIHCLWKP